ncbi:MAG: Type I signal peptidase [Candidatus Gottesmanbacteria bacterium GW2011_GWC2_39_8]|uniref:Signal peptidase I n=1 Tax=Candidatus Gottesmanbacteria bacterium GW2011_GWC2_39_8 TaxID=1618450 RepID=A0A0G0T7K4_9BACT|nr:MAG: Type I signal peptidase [Candidatus Gottesmanbacteria bacterium GW2011_GWC2_39_8]
MNPSINEGSVIIVKRSEVYQPGDIISYYGKIDGKETIITHRIMRIGGNVYLTKGDANQAYDDKIILPRLVIGRVIFIIPYIGYILSFAKNGLGLWLSVLLPAFVIIIIELIKVFDELSRKKFIHKK